MESDKFSGANGGESEPQSPSGPAKSIKVAATLSRIGLILSVVGIGLIFAVCGIVCGSICSKSGDPLGRTAVALGIAGALLSVIFTAMFCVCAFIVF